MDFLWHKLERAPGVWDFSALDAAVVNARQHGIGILAVAAYSNPIYPSEAPHTNDGTDLPLDYPPEVFFPPREATHYANFVEALVRHYGSDIKEYELWNEPNLWYRFWRPKADASQYTRMMALGAERGRAACPECRFIVGGLSMPQPIPRIDLYAPGDRFLQSMFDGMPDLSSRFDAVAFHPYQYPKDAPETETRETDEKPQGSLATQTKVLENILKKNGSSLPLWITENGWSTNPRIPVGDAEVARIFGLDPAIVRFGRSLIGEEDFAKVLESIRGVSETKQAQYLVRSILLGLELGVPINTIYTLDDFPIDTEINQESAFGVYRVDGSPKEAVEHLRTLLIRFAGYRFVAGSALGGMSRGDHAVLLRRGEERVLALWSVAGPRPITVRGLAACSVTSYAGAELRPCIGGEAQIDLGPSVTYLSFRP
jgi:hypothetical protein